MRPTDRPTFTELQHRRPGDRVLRRTSVRRRSRSLLRTHLARLGHWLRGLMPG